MELVEAEEAVGEDDVVERGSCSGLEWGVEAGGFDEDTHGIWRGFGHSRLLSWGRGLRVEGLGSHGVELTR